MEDFKSNTIKLFGIVYKEILGELVKMNDEAIGYLSFLSNLALSMGIYEEVLEELKRNMTQEEIENFLKFEAILSEAISEKEKIDNAKN